MDKVPPKVTKALYNKMAPNVDYDQFHMGVNSEMEHADVTGGDLVTTAKIALAHLKERPDYYTLLKKYVEKDVTAEIEEELLELMTEAKTSTERVRKYYKNHPEKTRAYLKKTQDDRVARNRDRRKATKKHGASKMKNHDVHHPNGPNGGSWRLAKKDHGPDKKNEAVESEPDSHDAFLKAHPAPNRIRAQSEMNAAFARYAESIKQEIEKQKQILKSLSKIQKESVPLWKAAESISWGRGQGKKQEFIDKWQKAVEQYEQKLKALGIISDWAQISWT